MEIIEGTIPTELNWRALVLLSAERPLSRTRQLAEALVKANMGQLFLVMIISDKEEETVKQAREVTAVAKAACSEDITVVPLIVVSHNFDADVNTLIRKAQIDLLLYRVDSPIWRNLSRASCAIAAVRGDRYEVESERKDSPHPDIKRILVPTSAGPNTVHALSFLVPLTPDIQVTALYVASERQEQEQYLGQSRLRQIINFVDGGDRIDTKVITAVSISQGIAEEAQNGYDMVIIGASRESSLDRVLFGDIPGAVVRESKRPVVIVRQPRDRLGNFLGDLARRTQQLLPRMNLQERTDAYVRIRRSARPDLDFFVLIGLSAIIAGLGLIINSPAVVIGAMLVAPLMSPIVGVGMAIVMGDTRFLRLSLGAVFRGVALSIFMGIVAGLFYTQPELNTELLGRTRPSLIDLGIALFSGLAGAYALCRSDAAGALPGVAIAAALVPPLSTVGIALINGLFPQALGAMLLFTTNFVSISSATALMFVILGFRPTANQKQRRAVQVRSARIAAVMVIVVSVMLGIFTIQLSQESARETRIQTVVSDQLALLGATLDEPPTIEFETADIESEDGLLREQTLLHLDVVARSPRPISFTEVVEIQKNVGTTLQNDGILDGVEMTILVIEVDQLDPLVPPTATPTPTPTETFTPGPTPTATQTSTPEPTDTPQPTATFTVEPTSTPTFQPTATSTPEPTATVIPSPTPVTAVVTYPYGLRVRTAPNLTADVIAVLPQGTVVILQDNPPVTTDGFIWQRIALDDVVGWASIEFLSQEQP